MTEKDVRKLILTKIEEMGSINAFAREFHIDLDRLCLILAGFKDIDETMLNRLGIKRVITYRLNDDVREEGRG